MDQIRGPVRPLIRDRRDDAAATDDAGEPVGAHQPLDRAAGDGPALDLDTRPSEPVPDLPRATDAAADPPGRVDPGDVLHDLLVPRRSR